MSSFHTDRYTKYTKAKHNVGAGAFRMDPYASGKGGRVFF